MKRAIQPGNVRFWTRWKEVTDKYESVDSAGGVGSDRRVPGPGSSTLRKAYGRMQGVRDVNVSLAHEEALIEYESGAVGEEELKQTLRDLGYTVRAMVAMVASVSAVLVNSFGGRLLPAKKAKQKKEYIRHAWPQPNTCNPCVADCSVHRSRRSV